MNYWYVKITTKDWCLITENILLVDCLMNFNGRTLTLIETAVVWYVIDGN